MSATNAFHIARRKDILELVAEIPGLSTRVIADYFPDSNMNRIASELRKLTAQGKIIATPGPPPASFSSGRSPHTYKINPNPNPVPVQPKLKLVKPTEAGIQARFESMQAAHDELLAWKIDAIQRYPDLAVDPAVLKARKIVANMLEESGDRDGARAVKLGQRDKTMILRAVLEGMAA